MRCLTTHGWTITSRVVRITEAELLPSTHLRLLAVRRLDDHNPRPGLGAKGCLPHLLSGSLGVGVGQDNDTPPASAQQIERHGYRHSRSH